MSHRHGRMSPDCLARRAGLLLGPSAGLVLLALTGCAATSAPSAASHAGTAPAAYAPRQDVGRVSSALSEKLDRMLAAQMPLSAQQAPPGTALARVERGIAGSRTAR